MTDKKRKLTITETQVKKLTAPKVAEGGVAPLDQVMPHHPASKMVSW